LNEQPLFVQPVVKPGCTTGLTTGCIHDTAVCQIGCQTRFDNRLTVCIHDTTGCETGLTGCIVLMGLNSHRRRRSLNPVYTMQPVGKPVINRFDNWTNVCTRYNRLPNPFYNLLFNCTANWTTSCIV